MTTRVAIVEVSDGYVLGTLTLTGTVVHVDPSIADIVDMVKRREHFTDLGVFAYLARGWSNGYVKSATV